MPSKQEIIDAIIKIDDSAKGLQSMKKSELEELHANLSAAFDGGTIVAEENPLPAEVQEQVVEEETPNMYDPKWTDWVLSQMEDYEKEGGNPKVDGLRRIAGKLLGTFSSQTVVHQTPDNSNSQRATITVTVQFDNMYGNSYTGAADVYPGNTNKDFARHAVATAETRAEGRALKRALCLTKVISAEEVYDKNLAELSDGTAKASDAMVKGLQMQAQKQGIDPYKLAIFNEIDIEDIKELTRSQVQLLSAKVSMYHRGEEDVPEGIKS